MKHKNKTIIVYLYTLTYKFSCIFNMFVKAFILFIDDGRSMDYNFCHRVYNSV